MTELPDECDFCGQWLDEDEELEPVYVGEMPNPRTQYIEEVVDKGGTSHHLAHGPPRVLGREPAEWKALLQALQKTDNIEVEISRHVYHPPQMVKVKSDPENIPEFDAHIDDEKAGVTIRIEPRLPFEPTPDLEVCQFCAENFRSE